MTYYEKALKRVNMLRGHVNLTWEAKKESTMHSFNLDKAREAFFNTFPECYFESFEVLSKLHGIDDPSENYGLKEKLREDTNVLLVRFVYKLFELGLTTPEKIAENIDYFVLGATAIGSFNYQFRTLLKKTIKNLGTEKHYKELIDGTSLKTFGCFGLTELGHGSNVRGIETTAEFDHENNEFIINSPTKTSIKFWIGNLGKTCQNAVIFAQLFVKGENKGVHAFLFQIRDRANHQPLPGIEIGDSGDKLSMQGIDNGWVKFDHFRVSRDALLDKYGSVDEQGNYHSSIESDGKRFSTSIASLTGRRVRITKSSCDAALQCSTIAIRYGIARKQFGPVDQPESELMSYPLHQYRLIPLFAQSFANSLGGNRLIKLWLSNLPKLFEPKNRVTELCHGLSSVEKTYHAWQNQATLYEAKRACGGHGYSYYSLFCTFLGINDLNNTWEGDNDVLLMQTQQFLFKCMRWLAKDETLPETIEFLTLSPPDLSEYNCCVNDLKALQTLFRARANHFMHECSHLMMKDPSNVAKIFNSYQHFDLRDMCKAYHDTYVIDTLISWIETIRDKSTEEVFNKLALLLMQYIIVNDERFFEAILGEEKINMAKRGITRLCKELRKEIYSLTLVPPHPSKLLGQLGHEDLHLYDRMVHHLKITPGATERSEWWKLSYANSGK